MTDTADQLRRALVALDRLQTRLTAAEAARIEPIAIVGMACRLPGAATPAEYWSLLRDGREAIGEVPADRRAAFAACPDPALRRGGFLPRIDQFDAAFFGIGGPEAAAMDPHQRLLLEVAWEALERAGLAGGALTGSETGVFLALGAQNSDYAWAQLSDPAGVDGQAIGGSFHSLMAGRLSYFLDLTGPNLVVDAACASSLVALHLACQALRGGDCSAALVGAVNLILSPAISQAVAGNGLWSAQGACRSFGAEADGFVRGEGCGVVVLRRLSDAQAAGDRILAVIRGSAINHDGRSNGLTAPNGPAQERVLRRALANAGVAPRDVAFVEAHATGTPLGDAIEVQALAAVLGGGDRPLRLGSAKANIGHLEAASGMAGLIKTVLALQHGWLPPQPRFGAVNPELFADGSTAEVVAAGMAWPDGRRIAGVSAFGMSGANAHVVLEAAPAAAAPAVTEAAPFLGLSARDPEALRRLAGALAEAIGPDTDWNDLCWSLNRGRRHFAHRIAVEGGIAAARAALAAYAAGGPAAAPAGAAAQAYLAGQLPDTPSAGRWLDLPTYPFTRRRHWLAEKTAPLPLHEIAWQPKTLAAPVTASDWLVLSDGAAGPRLAALLGGRAAPAPAEGGTASDVAVLWPWEADDTAASPATLSRLFGRILRLVQMPGTRRLTFVARGDRPLPGMVVGLVRALGSEHPELRARVIETADDVPDALLARALGHDDDEDWMRLTPGGRLVPRLAPLPAPVEAAPPARPDGIYLVTGGFGGVGRQVAAWLIARGARHLVLVGRRGGTVPAELAGRARIEAVALDVADADGMAALVARLRAAGRPIVGIYHAAGVTADGLIARQDYEAFARPMAAKVIGADLLDRLTRSEPVAEFVLFSSITAVTGIAGTAGYAAANAGLDALAQARAAAGLPALSVAWGTWRGSGMAAAASTGQAASWAEHGIHDFTPERGLAALGALLARRARHAIAADADWGWLARWAREERAGTALFGEAAPASPPVADRPATSAAMAAAVRAALAAVLQRRPDDPDLDLPFGELGLASLAAIELRNILSVRLGLALPATLAFNHPSAAGLAAHLMNRIGPPDIDTLSEEEAESLLVAKLAALGRRHSA